jgi:mono/diheme cytochrome c family protein
MKKMNIVKIIGIAVAALVVILFLCIAYIYFFLPNIPVQDLKVEVTPGRVERGKYLANHVTVCMDCHSTRDWSKFSGPPVPGTEGKGGEKFDQTMGFPGKFFSPNITPFSLASWSDGEIFRAITSGVGKGDRPFFPVMPYTYYGQLDKEDIYSIIAYLRTLPTIEYKAPDSDPDFPMNIILHMIPGKAAPSVKPEKSDTLAYGQYLVKAAGCIECHTKDKKGQIIKELAFSGGREFKMPDGLLVTPNITPDKETGIGNWTRDDFIKRFKAYDLATYAPPAINKGDLMTVMPWTMYAGMDTTDLCSVYKALMALKPMSNKVVRWMPYK